MTIRRLLGGRRPRFAAWQKPVMRQARPGRPPERAAFQAPAVSPRFPFPIWPFAALFFLTRLPFLLGGYGADTDAYRVALSARYLWSRHEYLPSRLPGYPLHELTTALLLPGGPFLTNLATAIIAFGGVLILDRIVVTLGAPHRRWLVLAMAFTPWLLVNSATTLDYHWALTLMLAAYLAALRGHSARAGLALGLAAGFRLTAGAFLLPLLLAQLGGLWPWAVARGDKRTAPRVLVRRSVEMIATTLTVALLCYLPVLWTYRLRFWNYADSRVPPDVVIQMVGQRALGVIGALAALAALAGSWRQLRGAPAVLRADPQVAVWLLTVAIYAIAFLRLPVDVGYLIPLYPFAFLLAARLLARWALPLIVTATVLCGFVDIDMQGIHNFSPGIARRELRPSWREANFAHDLHERWRYRDFAVLLGRKPAPPHSVVLIGGAFPDFAVLNWDRFRYEIVERDRSAVSMLSDNSALWDDANDVVYLPAPPLPLAERLVDEGYHRFAAAPGLIGAPLRPNPFP